MSQQSLSEAVLNIPLEVLKAWAPLLVALIIFAAIYVGVRRLFTRQREAGTGSRYREQGLKGLLGLLFLLAMTITAPISDTLRGQLLSLIGIVISAAIALSSTTVMGNLIAGFMLRVVSNLKAGDFIRAGEQFGRITERGLLHIEIQTEDSDLVTLPNLVLVQHPFTLIRASGTMISAEVSLGYDVSRVDIEKALLNAAEKAGLEEAFVQVRELGDFSVVYRLSGKLTEVRQIVSARSRLRAAMLDALHAAGIEIVSPTFMNQRQLKAEQKFIPRRAVPPDSAQHANGAAIEEVLFDKAEKAELAERLEKRLKALREQMDEVEEKLSGAKDDETVRAECEKRLEHLKKREAKVEILLEETRAEAKQS